MDPGPTRVEKFLDAVSGQTLFKGEEAQGSILWHIRFYRSRAPRRRLAFRAAGFALLFLSISLPFVTQFSDPAHRPIVASAMSWLIALVAAANSFYGWQEAWQLYTQTQMQLRFAPTRWEGQVAKAKAAPTDAEGVQILIDALEKLQSSVSEAVSNEAAEYFEG